MQKKSSAERIRQAGARISVLETLASRLQAGENVTDDEIARSRRMVREGAKDLHEEVNKAGGMVKEADVDWKTVILGRSVKEREGVEAEFLKVLEDGASGINFHVISSSFSLIVYSVEFYFKLSMTTSFSCILLEPFTGYQPQMCPFKRKLKCE